MDYPVRDQKLEDRALLFMADHIGDAVIGMRYGNARWVTRGSGGGGTSYDGSWSMVCARSLIEFLVGRSWPKQSDIWPTDYVPSWTVDATTTTDLGDRLTMIDQRLAHLSLARVNDPADPPEPWSDTVERITVLVEQLVSEARSPFVTRLSEAIQTARQLDENTRADYKRLRKR